MKRTPSKELAGNICDNKKTSTKINNKLTSPEFYDTFDEDFNLKTKKIRQTTVEDSEMAKPSASMVEEVLVEAVEEHKEDINTDGIENGKANSEIASVSNSSFVYVENNEKIEVESTKTNVINGVREIYPNNEVKEIYPGNETNETNENNETNATEDATVVPHENNDPDEIGEINTINEINEVNTLHEESSKKENKDGIIVKITITDNMIKSINVE